VSQSLHNHWAFKGEPERLAPCSVDVCEGDAESGLADHRANLDA